MSLVWFKLFCMLLVFQNGHNTGKQHDLKKLYNYNSPYKELITVYEAKNLEFGFPNEKERQAALRDGRYQPYTPVPIDVDVYYPPTGLPPIIFVTIPRFGQGVPYSVAYLTDIVRPAGRELQAYPNYDWHKTHGRDCDGLTSVYRIQIDSCGQMWILDSGEIEFVQYCAPQLVVLNVVSGKLLHRYRLPTGQYKPTISRFVTPYVDIADPAPHGECKKAFVYMADASGYGIVVYDFEKGQSWRIENKFTYPDPDFGTHTVAGESFELLDGTFAFAATPPSLKVRRNLYFHSLSNDAAMAIPLNIINNQTYWLNADISTGLKHFICLGKRGIQCTVPAITESGVLLCGHLAPIGIFGWNIRTPYKPNNRVLLAENPRTLQFASGTKVKRNFWGKEEVWLLTNRIQRAFIGTMNFSEINYRILRCGVDELLSGSPCVDE